MQTNGGHFHAMGCCNTIGGGHNPGNTPKDTISTENHQQVAARLGIHGGLIFAHGTPTKKVKKG